LYGDTSDIGTLTLYLAIPEGGQPQKLSDVDYLWTLNGGAVTIVTGTDADSVSLLQAGDRAKITITLAAANKPGPGDSFTLEIKPKVGASSLISKTLGSGYAGGVII